MNADSRYFTALKAGDLDSARKALEDAAEAESFTFGPLYHGGTLANGFSASSEAGAHYTSFDLEAATTYAGQYSEHEGRVTPLFVRAKNLLDLTDEAAFLAAGFSRDERFSSPERRLLVASLGSGSSGLDALRKAGYDAVCFYDTDASNRGAYKTLAFFSASQAKIAPRNSGQVIGETWWGYPVQDGLVVKDCDGDIIPPSRRFIASEDIRGDFDRRFFSDDDRYYNAFLANNIESAAASVREAATGAGFGIGPVFHGTKNNAFTSFNRDCIRSEDGFCFSTLRENAKEYAGDDGRILEVFLRVRRPYSVTAREWGEGTGLSPEAAWAQGYDGYCVKGMDCADTWLVPEPSQIKLADPFVFSSDGGIIPPSQRFDAGSDIRGTIGDGSTLLAGRGEPLPFASIRGGQALRP